LDEFFGCGWLKLTDTPVRTHRIKGDLDQALDWENGRRDALLEALGQWRDGPEVKYTTGPRMDYYLTCRSDKAAEQVRASVQGFGLVFESWGPQPE
jgi:hypothetical protein